LRSTSFFRSTSSDLFYKDIFMYKGDSLWQFQIFLYCTSVTSSTPSLPLDTLHAALKAIARGFLALFHINIRSQSTIFSHLNLLVSPSPLQQVPLSTEPISKSCFLLLIFKLMFKWIYQCIPAMIVLYFFHSTPSIAVSYPFTSYSPFSTALNTYPNILYFHRCFMRL
jgi:hypothetical protein